MKKKILFLNPPSEKNLSKFDNPKIICENLGIEHIISNIDITKFKSKYIDAVNENLKIDEIVFTIINNQYDMVAISVMFNDAVSQSLKIIRLLREKDFRGFICVGGHLPTVDPELFENEKKIDFIVRGDGVTVFNATLDQLWHQGWRKKDESQPMKSKHQKTSKKIYIEKNLNVHNPPDREKLPLILNKNGSAYISSSRGCYGQCSFCSIRKFHNPDSKESSYWRAISPEKLVNELHSISKKYKTTDFIFSDDNFLGVPGRSKKIERLNAFKDLLNHTDSQYQFCISCRVDDIDESILNILKQLGVETIHLGVESGIEKDLHLYKKNIHASQSLTSVKLIKKYNINCEVSFIMFNPYTTVDDIRKNLNFLAAIDEVDNVRISSRLVLMPNTEIKRMVFSDNTIQKIENHYGYIIREKEAYDLFRLFRILFYNTWKHSENFDIFKWLYFMKIPRKDKSEPITNFIYDSNKKISKMYFNIIMEFLDNQKFRKSRSKVETVVQKINLLYNNFNKKIIFYEEFFPQLRRRRYHG